jgi:hypothetical protein
MDSFTPLKNKKKKKANKLLLIITTFLMLILVMISSILVINNKAGQKPKANCNPCGSSKDDHDSCHGTDLWHYTCDVPTHCFDNGTLIEANAPSCQPNASPGATGCQSCGGSCNNSPSCNVNCDSGYSYSGCMGQLGITRNTMICAGGRGGCGGNEALPQYSNNSGHLPSIVPAIYCTSWQLDASGPQGSDARVGVIDNQGRAIVCTDNANDPCKTANMDCTPTPTPTPTPTSPTNTPSPTSTSTPTPTNTPGPTSTPTPTPTTTGTPSPTSTSTPTPTNTPGPTSTPIPTTTGTPSPTEIILVVSTSTPGSTKTTASSAAPPPVTGIFPPWHLIAIPSILLLLGILF